MTLSLSAIRERFRPVSTGAKGWYDTATRWIAGLVGVCAFFGTWFGLADSYGILGLLLGWFPASLVACLALLVAAMLWPFALIAAVAFAVMPP